MNRPSPLPPGQALAAIESELRVLREQEPRGLAAVCRSGISLLLLVAADLDPGAELLVSEAMQDLLAPCLVLHAAPDLGPGLVGFQVQAGHQKATGSSVPRIDLWLGPDTAGMVPSLVTALVGTSGRRVLCLGRGADPGLVPLLLPLASELLTDVAREPEPAFWALTRSRETTRLVDLGLLRTLRWRELAARWFDYRTRAAWEIRQLSVLQVPGENPGNIESKLLVSWFGARLGWQPYEGRILDRLGREIRVEFASVAVLGAPPGSLQELKLVASLPEGSLEGRIVRQPRGRVLEWSLSAPGQPRLQIEVPASLPRSVHHISRALGARQRDPVAREVLLWLAQLCRAGGAPTAGAGGAIGSAAGAEAGVS